MSKLVLSFGGDGVRGLIGLRFLTLLESKLIAETGKGVYETFDMFAGTSIGGIICSMMSVLKLKPSELESYCSNDMIRTMMPKTSFNQSLWYNLFRPKYDGVGKRKVLSDLLKKYAKRDDILLDSAEKPTLVTAYNLEQRRPEVLTSYNKQKITALDAADATSAASTFYPSVKTSFVIDGERKDAFLTDGGIVCNRPAMLAYIEAKLLWPEEKIKVFSVGLGIDINAIDGPKSKSYGILEWFRVGILNIMFDETIVHQQATSFLGKDYMRVTTDLPSYVSPSIDDTSDSNLDGLRKLGVEWFNTYGDAALNFIKSN